MKRTAPIVLWCPTLEAPALSSFQRAQLWCWWSGLSATSGTLPMMLLNDGTLPGLPQSWQFAKNLPQCCTWEGALPNIFLNAALCQGRRFAQYLPQCRHFASRPIGNCQTTCLPSMEPIGGEIAKEASANTQNTRTWDRRG